MVNKDEYIRLKSRHLYIPPVFNAHVAGFLQDFISGRYKQEPGSRITHSLTHSLTSLNAAVYYVVHAKFEVCIPDNHPLL